MTPTPPVRVVLIDDHAVVREGYRRLLERDAHLVVVAEGSNAADAMELDAKHKPDVLVLDIALPGVSGIEALRRIVGRRPGARLLIFSMHQESIFVSRALSAGACGFLSKASAPELLVSAVRCVAAGQRFLSPDVERALQLKVAGNTVSEVLSARELEVLRLLTQGFDISTVAERLGLSAKTAANHQSSIKQKLGADSALQLMLIAQQSGLIGPL